MFDSSSREMKAPAKQPGEEPGGATSMQLWRVLSMMCGRTSSTAS